jgi:hypothetical protein
MGPRLADLHDFWYRLAQFWLRTPRSDGQPWEAWAARMPRSAFVIWLAGHVADDLIEHTGATVSVQQMIDAVDDSTGVLQHTAERFIENYYFGYPSDDPHLYRLISIFRRIVKRKLRRHM